MRKSDKKSTKMASEKFCLSCAGTTLSDLVKHFGRDFRGIPRDRDDKDFFDFCNTLRVRGGRSSRRRSKYLATLGELLDRSIKVFWTGGKFVSSTITAKEIKKLSEVIKRKPVLWDNLHANDYDHQRVFLGPYTGLVFFKFNFLLVI